MSDPRSAALLDAICRCRGAREPLRFEATLGSSLGACPRCKTAALEAGRAGDLALARCPSCQGLWVPFGQRDPGVTSSAWDWLDFTTTPHDALQLGKSVLDLLDFLGGIDP